MDAVVRTLRQVAYAVLSVMLSLLGKVRERGELPRVEWQANDHLLRMRAGARVAASRRHEPDRSEVQPRVALSVIRWINVGSAGKFLCSQERFVSLARVLLHCTVHPNLLLHPPGEHIQYLLLGYN